MNDIELKAYVLDLASEINKSLVAFTDFGTVSRWLWLRNSACFSTFTGHSVRMSFPKFTQTLRYICLMTADHLDIILIDNDYQDTGYQFEFLLFADNANAPTEILLNGWDNVIEGEAA